MDAEVLAAMFHADVAMAQASSDYPWRCPDHGASCPGRPHIKHKSHVKTCPEHGPKCQAKACAKLLEQHYSWDASKRKWTDPKECRDTCMECCTQALYDHPLKDQICEHACHTSCKLPFPKPLRKSSVPDAPPRSTIDSFAPQFTSFINSKSGFLGRDCYHNNGLREPYEPETEDAGLGEHSRKEEHDQSAKLIAFMSAGAQWKHKQVIPCVVENMVEKLAGPPSLDQAQLDRGVVENTFFRDRYTEGLVLIELCAGIASGLEAILLQGWKVKRYYYVDIDPISRDIARHRVANLSARFPYQFPPTARVDAFSLPQDINAVRDYHIDHYFAGQNEQILVMAGWPCQEYSPAGKGKPGPRAAILDKVISIIARLQALQPVIPVAYLMENVALHLNFRHEHIRDQVAAEVNAKIGQPITFDAANVGSYATMVRNYWTNIASQLSMQRVYDELRLPCKGNLYNILEPGRHPIPVTKDSRDGHNKAGEVRSVLPTLMSYRRSRAFRPGQPGSIYAEDQRAFLEPTALERELAMGYEPGTTAAPEVDEGERCSALG